MTSSDYNVARTGRKRIVETVRVLFAAGSRVIPSSHKAARCRRQGRRCSPPLQRLLHLTRIMNRKVMETHCDMYTAQLQLIAELIQLLLSNGAILDDSPLSGPLYYLNQVEAAMRHTDERSSDEDIDSYIVIVDIYSDICKSFLFAVKPCVPITNGLPRSFQTRDNRNLDITQALLVPCIRIAGRVARCYQSLRFLDLIVDSLSWSQMNCLKNKLIEQQKQGALDRQPGFRDRRTPEEYLRLVNNALKWIEGRESRMSLKHLARLAIIRVMSHRSVQAVASLELPVDLQKYVLLQSV